MIAMFLAQKIILEKITFDEVPHALKYKVKELLIESGVGYLAKR